MALFDSDRPVDWTEIVTYDAAEALNPYKLAQHWGDPMCRPFERSDRDELAELACMSALARWLIRWQPISVHRALLKGASVESVAAALGTSPDQACRIWHEWASQQRESVVCGRPGVSADEYAQVAETFTAARVELPDTGAAE